MLREWKEFEMGSVVTFEWARELPKDEVPLFLVVGIVTQELSSPCKISRSIKYIAIIRIMKIKTLAVG